MAKPKKEQHKANLAQVEGPPQAPFPENPLLAYCRIDISKALQP
jgi:hypothetical protein